MQAATAATHMHSSVRAQRTDLLHALAITQPVRPAALIVVAVEEMAGAMSIAQACAVLPEIR